MTTAIKTNIFGQLQWSIRNPSRKEGRQHKHEEREKAKLGLTSEPDPRVEKREQILKHTGWKR